ncbi:DegT/DnrJ/EryC1/StrS family aminotransferase [Candidatus Nitrosotenuis chungbukensis]|uniref:DegT/DnrJ/EryC1/StrS family aminotransferase n=1 Tax=Candidatus Nitrosotenuis chungbukensis TaxID=1353246 RepID=UPI0005B296F6|nr:DegT/DnrJ/EryC1/StrS family aminotransferase [Candidatus Nitrosotenuis chungbukensis]WKT58303.1 DegT/DnrJ/EryC1/StrS family aminotransferase [Candidatus Nitrosotenuis chungbukensis]
MKPKKRIKLFDPVIDDQEQISVKKVLDSHFWASGAGTGSVQKFEQSFSKYVHSKSCIAVNSGTAALHLALSMMDIKNKEVILPSLSFVSTAHSILYNGGIPKFAEINPDTLCLDPHAVEDVITEKTQLILPVHFAGLACDLNSLNILAEKHGIHMIEDAAHAAGTSYNDKKIGSHSELVCFSFHPAKNIATPGGGAITINSQPESIEPLLKSKRWCGISNRKNSIYDVDQLGWNFYMNEFSAAIGIEQLKKLEKNNKKRKEVAKRYFAEISLAKKMPLDLNSSYHFYWIRVKNRTKFMGEMYENGVETGIHYKPIHMMTLYRRKEHLPTTEKVAQEIVSLPTHPNLSEEDVTTIIKLVNKFSN